MLLKTDTIESVWQRASKLSERTDLFSFPKYKVKVIKKLFWEKKKMNVDLIHSKRGILKKNLPEIITS